MSDREVISSSSLIPWNLEILSRIELRCSSTILVRLGWCIVSSVSCHRHHLWSLFGGQFTSSPCETCTHNMKLKPIVGCIGEWSEECRRQVWDMGPRFVVSCSLKSDSAMEMTHSKKSMIKLFYSKIDPRQYFWNTIQRSKSRAFDRLIPSSVRDLSRQTNSSAVSIANSKAHRTLSYLLKISNSINNPTASFANNFDISPQRSTYQTYGHSIALYFSRRTHYFPHTLDGVRIARTGIRRSVNTRRRGWEPGGDVTIMTQTWNDYATHTN
jgi:hypothetical protein